MRGSESRRIAGPAVESDCGGTGPRQQRALASPRAGLRQWGCRTPATHRQRHHACSRCRYPATALPALSPLDAPTPVTAPARLLCPVTASAAGLKVGRQSPAGGRAPALRRSDSPGRRCRLSSKWEEISARATLLLSLRSQHGRRGCGTDFRIRRNRWSIGMPAAVRVRRDASASIDHPWRRERCPPDEREPTGSRPSRARAQWRR